MTELPDGGVPTVAGEGVTAPRPTPDEHEGEPIELLVGLAEEGEIDPWDIDIVRVTDKFLERLDRADLRTSARALFYASVLLRMKSDVLLEPDEPEEPELEPGGDLGGDPWRGPESPAPPGEDPLSSLEAELDRRLDRKRARGKPETLDELVRELRDVEREAWWKESRTYDTTESPSGFQRGTQTLDYRASDERRGDGEPTEADVTRTAHGEDMEATKTAVREALEEHFSGGRREVLFDEIDAAGGSRVETFLAVLFLAGDGTIRLEQDALFGDLWIQAG